MRAHARAIGIEDSCDFYVDIVLTMVIEEQCFRATLTLVITGSDTDWVYVAEIVFGLRMHRWIAVHLARRGKQNAAFSTLCDSQHIDRTHHGRLGGLDGIGLVVNRRRWASQVIDAVHFDIKRERHVMPHELEIRCAKQVGNVALRPGEKIVDAKNVVPLGNQTVA